MRVGVLGINHKLANLDLRELLARTCQRRLHPECSTHGEHSFILLSTCNRTEIYFSSEDLAASHSYLLAILRQDATDDFDQKLYSYFGKDCLLHLCRVTAGLDSAIVAETEIQGQVKNAYENAVQFTRLPFEMHYLFQKSLGIAKKVRSSLPLKPGLPDIEHAIYQTGVHFFKEREKAKVLFIGASEINEKILIHLKNKGIANITLCNRTYTKGAAIARKHSIELSCWENLSEWHQYDWIILGTKASDFLLHTHPLKESSQKKLVIDLGVPRNVHPSLARHSGITLLNIDQINRRLKIRRTQMALALDFAEGLVNSAVQQQVALFGEKERNRLRLCAI